MHTHSHAHRVWLRGVLGPRLWMYAHGYVDFKKSAYAFHQHFVEYGIYSKTKAGQLQNF